MQRELTTKWSRISPLAPAFLGMALFVGCGDSAGTTPTGDAASAYAALSAELQQCATDADTCSTAANGDATKQAACDAAEKACKAKTDKDAAKARGKLEQAAAGCYKGRGHDDDGGVADKGGRDERCGCVERQAPREENGGCLDALLSCLEGKATPGSGQNAALMSCVADAHTCIMDNMPTRGNGGHMGPGNAAGAGAPPIGPIGHAGSGGIHKPAPAAGTGGGFKPPVQHVGAGGGFAPPALPGQHGTAGEDHSGPGRGQASAGAGGSHH
jgi:hypothetical protein